jgi:uncharacterized phiE125 gp8 family phage protein
MSLQLITPPSSEPVALADAKAFLKVDVTDDDALIGSLITAARARTEWHTGRALMTQSWVLWLDLWPICGIIEIPLPPLVGVTQVATYALDDTMQVIDPATYIVDAASQPARIAQRKPFPPPLLPPLRPVNAVSIAFNAGYGDATAVPIAICQAIKCIVADLYTNRGDANAVVGPEAAALLEPYRIFKL